MISFCWSRIDVNDETSPMVGGIPTEHENRDRMVAVVGDVNVSSVDARDREGTSANVVVIYGRDIDGKEVGADGVVGNSDVIDWDSNGCGMTGNSREDELIRISVSVEPHVSHVNSVWSRERSPVVVLKDATDKFLIGSVEDGKSGFEGSTSGPSRWIKASEVEVISWSEIAHNSCAGVGKDVSDLRANFVDSVFAIARIEENVRLPGNVDRGRSLIGSSYHTSISEIGHRTIVGVVDVESQMRDPIGFVKLSERKNNGSWRFVSRNVVGMVEHGIKSSSHDAVHISKVVEEALTGELRRFRYSVRTKESSFSREPVTRVSKGVDDVKSGVGLRDNF